jgi:hypothetical protein
VRRRQGHASRKSIPESQRLSKNGVLDRRGANLANGANGRSHAKELAFLAFGALSLCALALLGPSASAAPPSSGDWVVTANESYANQTIVIEGNVFVRAPGQLTLTNVTLEINSTTVARRGLEVEAGATLNTRDLDGLAGTAGDRTVIRPLSPLERIFVVGEAGSTLDLRQSALWGVGYTQSPINASAFYIATNATNLHNVTVYSSYFGIYFAAVAGTFFDLSVHNNTYDGLELDALCNITVRGFSGNNNGGAGVHISGGRFTLSGASLLANADGLAVKFGGVAAVSLFDASGNVNGFVALNGATLNLSQGRVTNNTAAGVDARQSSVVNVNSLLLSDNTAGLYANLGSTFSLQSAGFARGVHALQLRSGSTASFTGVRIEGTSGDALDLDNSSMDLFSCVLESNAIGGTVTASTGFGFLDSSLLNSTGAGFTFVNSTGIYLHNPMFVNNRGRAVDLVGASNALLDASGVAEINRSVVDVRSLTVSGTLRIVDATLHAVAVASWTVSGAFFASNATIVGDVVGASLTVQGGASAFARALAVVDFDLRLSAASQGADFDGVAQSGTGELAALLGNYTWRNTTQTGGAGRIRAAEANLSLIGGSAAALRAEDGGHIDIIDFSASLAAAAYVGSGTVRQFWTTELETLWAPAVPAPAQNYTVRNASSGVVASGQTDASGQAALGAVLADVGSSGGVVSENPHRFDAGAGSWAASLIASVTSAGVVSVTLSDVAPPTITIQAPTQGAVVSGNPITVSGTASDGESGVATVAWSFDNVTFNLGVVGNPFSLPVPANFETTFVITVRAEDFAGNGAYATVTYRVDRTAPLIVLTSPNNGTALRGPTVRFVGGTEVGASLTINGTLVAVDLQGDFDANVSVAEGDITVGLTAVDGAGNVYTLQVSLRIDSTAPAIVISFPAYGSTVAGRTVDLFGYVEPGAGLSVDNVSQVVLLNGSFAVNVDLLAEGPNMLYVRSLDAAGNENVTMWLLVRDTRAPLVSVAGLVGPGPFSLNASAPAFNITTDEVAFIEASITPGAAATSTTGQQLLFSPALSEGLFQLRIRAEDGVGNARVWNFSLRIDITAPSFTLDAITEAGFVNGTPWRLSVGAEAGAQVTVGGVAATPTAPGSAAFTASIDLNPGANTVVVVVVDAAGNRATRTINLTLDQTPPVVAITSPAASLTTPDAQLTVQGTTEQGARVTVSGRDAPVDASGHFIAVVNLGFGTNNIVVVATDRAGNSATASRQVTRSTGSHGLTGNEFIDGNLMAILVLIALGIAGALLAMRGGDKRRALDDKAAAIERDLEGARASRNDLNAIENFQSRSVTDEDFVSADDFRRRMGQEVGPPTSPDDPGKGKPES